MKKVYLFTVNYPFSHGEHLLQYEVLALMKKFDSVTIVCADTISQKHYEIPSEVDVIRNSFELSVFDKIYSLLNIFSKVFWSELRTILIEYNQQLTLSKIYSILLSIGKGNKVKKFIEYEIAKEGNAMYFYSWWTITATNGFAFAKKNNPHIKIVTRARAVDLYFERHKNNYIPLRKYLYESLDNIFCISSDGQNYIKNRFRSDKINGKLIVSRVGCVNRNNYLNAIENNNQKTIVTCSNIISLKRLHLVIEAIALIDNINIHWIHFGDGDLKDEITILSEEKLRNKKNIKYDFKGYVNNTELFNFYGNNYVDLFINVSEYEGIPVTIMEAMSFGIPVIATDVGGVSEIVNRSNGFLLSKDLRFVDLSKTMKEFFKMEDIEKLVYRKNARRTWETDYNSDNNFKELAKIISKL